MRQPLILYPFLLFAGIFAIDKLALIPDVRLYGRHDSSALENVRISLESGGSPATKDGEKRIDALVQGTSRSEIFNSLHKDTIEKNEYVDDDEKRLLLSANYETNGIVKASELLGHYSMIYSALKRSRKPDLIVLEISPEMFNQNSYTNMNVTFTNNIYEFDLLTKFFEITEGSLRGEALLRIMFASYAYRFKPDAALKNYINDKSYLERARMPIFLLMQRKRVTPLGDKFVDYPERDMPADIFKERFSDYAKKTAKDFLRDYRFDPAELRALQAIMELAAERNRPIAVWIPFVHPELEKHQKETEFYARFNEIKQAIRDKNVPFYDARRDNLECRRYVDASHISNRCAPLIMSRILKIARKRYKILNNVK